MNITYTKTNRASVERLLKTMKVKEVEQYLLETYEAIKETPGIKSIARLFSSKIAKGERQILSPKQKKENIIISSTKQEIMDYNSKKKNIVSNVNNVEDNILNEFYKLSEYEQLKIEEKALTMCLNEEKIEEGFLLNMKEISKPIYYSTLKKYIQVILDDKSLLKANETSN